ncbi:MAG: tRNA (N(6)-L-threonylcarbamoyladenosine(37)-C(2))-methylthiotransferase MtaB [Lachnospiraceae bacterium]|nr:tRNA (N(6)-L-threonylcarbamoyladenosine(37)-C(2))-methylthiotransferase MtaB [Lachnospiraceae bacterium]
MMQSLQKKGFIVVPFDQKADVYIVNTCTVTSIADRKSRQMLHRAKKCNPEAVVVAVGCYVGTDPERVAADPAIDLAVENSRKEDIADIIEEYLRAHGRMPEETAETAEKQQGALLLEAPGRVRADIKIQDGCNQFCTYCIIPYARGRIRSRTQEEIVEEITGLAKSGTREVVLSGIHTGSFGMDRGKPELQELLPKLDAIPGLERIRLGSLEPRIMTKEFVETLAACPRVCPHFHLSLQSGSDTVLKRMNRHYTAAEFLSCMDRLRAAYDRPALTTDVIVGFPGETEAEFAETVRFLEKADFYEIHIFRYSRRSGTPAAAMEGQVEESVKAQRSDILQKLTYEQSQRFRASFRGGEEEILAEEVLTEEAMRHRTQNEMSPVKAVQTEGSGTADGSRRYLVGHTSRYIEAGIVLGEGDAGPAPGTLLRGCLSGEIPGTPCLRMERL